MKHRLTTLITEIHTHLRELSQFPGWDFIRPLPTLRPLSQEGR